MIQASHYFPDYQFVVGGAPSIDIEYYQTYIAEYKIPIIYNQTYNLIKNSTAALVTSGTATLETALLNTPQIVCYHTNMGNFLYKMGMLLFVKVKWLSLVNLILNYEAIKELTQNTFKKEYIVKELNKILNNKTYRNNILDSYKKLQNLIGTAGASKKAASKIYESISTQKL